MRGLCRGLHFLSCAEVGGGGGYAPFSGIIILVRSMYSCVVFIDFGVDLLLFSLRFFVQTSSWDVVRPAEDFAASGTSRGRSSPVFSPSFLVLGWGFAVLSSLSTFLCSDILQGCGAACSGVLHSLSLIHI